MLTRYAFARIGQISVGFNHRWLNNKSNDLLRRSHIAVDGLRFDKFNFTVEQQSGHFDSFNQVNKSPGQYSGA